MTCEKCGNKEVLFQEKSENSTSRYCSVCDKLHILTKEESKKLIESQYQYFDKIFINYIEKFNKKSLIVWLQYFTNWIEKSFSFIPISKYFSLNV